MTRREATRLIGVSAAGLCLPVRASHAQAKAESSAMLTRAIPSSGEKLPVIGLGTWQAFDVDLTSDNRRQLGDVLSLFVKLGGRVIDTSPMYGRAEDVIGELATALGIQDKLFLATKVWTRGRENGIKSMERSMALLRAKRIDLMQVHNLVDVQTQLATLREWKAQGRIRYLGITHYEAGALPTWKKSCEAKSSILCRSTIHSWNAKQKSAFCRLHRNARLPSSSIGLLAAAISSVERAQSNCLIGPLNLIVIPGRNFSSNGS